MRIYSSVFCLIINCLCFIYGLLSTNGCAASLLPHPLHILIGSVAPPPSVSGTSVPTSPKAFGLKVFIYCAIWQGSVSYTENN